MHKDKYTHITDNELLHFFYAEKDNKWIGILLQRYTLLLLGTCMKYLKNEEEAKDSVQQIFLKAITELNKYEVTYFKSWIYMIAKNHCLMKLRDKNIFVEATENQQLPLEETDIDELNNKENILTHIEYAINELNEEQKTCVTLFYLKKKSYQEIANITGFNLLQVKSHIQNGKRNLKLVVEKRLNKN